MTVEEIISAYKQACQKLSCKQIPKLLKQIQVERVEPDLRAPCCASCPTALIRDRVH